MIARILVCVRLLGVFIPLIAAIRWPSEMDLQTDHSIATYVRMKLKAAEEVSVASPDY